MKHEILKKTLLYRTMAFILGMGVTTLFLFNKPLTSLWLTIVSEMVSVCSYYLYEYYWRRRIESIRIKKGMHLLQMADDQVKIRYNVVEVLEDNKIVIEVV